MRIHQSRSHPPVKVAPTSQGRTHQSRSHPPVKVAPTNQGRTHQSRSHPPVKVASTSQGRTHHSRSHPPAKVELQRGVPCGSPQSGQPALPCTIQTGTCQIKCTPPSTKAYSPIGNALSDGAKSKPFRKSMLVYAHAKHAGLLLSVCWILKSLCTCF